MGDATPREVADAIHYAADEAARIVSGTPGTEDDRAVRIVAKALLTADAVAAITYTYNALRGEPALTTVSEWIALIGPVAGLVIGWIGGHRQQINTLLKAAADLGPDAVSLLHQIRAAAKAGK